MAKSLGVYVSSHAPGARLSNFLRSLQSGVTSESNRLEKSSGRKRAARRLSVKNFFYGTNVTPALGERETPEKGNPKRPKRAIGGSGFDFFYDSSFIQENFKVLCTSDQLRRASVDLCVLLWCNRPSSGSATTRSRVIDVHCPRDDQRCQQPITARLSVIWPLGTTSTNVVIASTVGSVKHFHEPYTQFTPSFDIYSESYFKSLWAKIVPITVRKNTDSNIE